MHLFPFREGFPETREDFPFHGCGQTWDRAPGFHGPLEGSAKTQNLLPAKFAIKPAAVAVSFEIPGLVPIDIIP